MRRVLVLTNLAKGSTVSISPDDPTLGDDSVGPGALSALAAPTIVYTASATVRHPLAGMHVGPFPVFTKRAGESVLMLPTLSNYYNFNFHIQKTQRATNILIY